MSPPAPRRGFRTCAKCNANRAERFFLPKGRTCARCRKGRVALASRDVRLMRSYGLTLEDYATIVAEQGGKCAICGGTRRTNLDVDHDHKTGLIRGAACPRCNRQLLRHARDSAALLRSAADYLDNPPAQNGALGPRYVPGFGP